MGDKFWSPKWIKRSKFDDRALHAHKTHLLIKCLVATWFLHETDCEQLAFLVVSDWRLKRASIFIGEPDIYVQWICNTDQLNVSRHDISKLWGHNIHSWDKNMVFVIIGKCLDLKECTWLFLVVALNLTIKVLWMTLLHGIELVMILKIQCTSYGRASL
jgi:hypothetical protein